MYISKITFSVVIFKVAGQADVGPFKCPLNILNGNEFNKEKVPHINIGRFLNNPSLFASVEKKKTMQTVLVLVSTAGSATTSTLVFSAFRANVGPVKIIMN